MRGSGNCIRNTKTEFESHTQYVNAYEQEKGSCDLLLLINVRNVTSFSLLHNHLHSIFSKDSKYTDRMHTMKRVIDCGFSQVLYPDISL